MTGPSSPESVFQPPLLEQHVSDNYAGIASRLSLSPKPLINGRHVTDFSRGSTYGDVTTYTSTLAFILSGYRQRPETDLASSQAYHFARQIGRIAIPQITDIKHVAVTVDLKDQDEMYDMLFETAATYLGSSQFLRGLTTLFLPQLDPSGRFNYVAEIVAGTTFLAIDEAERERVIGQAVDQFGAEIAAFEDRGKSR